jgi:phosphoglycerol transferase MdoB-like AlkP superfamily enzyme
VKTKLAIITIIINCAVALAAGVSVYSVIALGGLARQWDAASQPMENGVRPSGKDEAVINFDKKTLMDRDKTLKSIKSMNKDVFKLKHDDPLVYTKLPEREFFNSLFSYFFLTHLLSAKEVTLDEKTVQKFKKEGILLYSMDRMYPLMKKSIYLDRSRKTANKPVVKVGTNVIIIFVESLSAFFLNEEAHGLKGLMPNIRGMGRDSYSFESMYNTSFPTIKGLIAALGSSVYLLDENIGGTRIPIPCRFLFLSNILKARNYTTAHLQAGSERFIGMKDLFTKREGYDFFYGSESLAIEKLISLRRGFGVDDDTLFDFVVDWLEKYSGEKPLLLTISTINSHPPYKVKYKHPGAGENDMLNALYSTDKAFGKFWDYFKKSKYRNNTLVILTADHAMGNNKEYIAFMKNFEDYYRPYFDVIPCYMHFPGGAWNGATNKTPCVSMDLTPTILDMMNLDMANPFMGLSIFSERPYYKAKNNSIAEIKNIDAKKVEEAKKLLSFFLNLYREDRIIPKDYSVKSF